MLCVVLDGCVCAFDVCMLLCIAVIVMSTHVMSCLCLGVVGMSELYMLKSMGERKACCGTSVLN